MPEGASLACRSGLSLSWSGEEGTQGAVRPWAEGRDRLSTRHEAGEGKGVGGLGQLSTAEISQGRGEWGEQDSRWS